MTQTAAQTTAIPQALRDRWASAPKGHRSQTDHSHRAFQVDRAATDEAARTVTLAFASETPYDRWWGTEILECTPAAMRLGRLQTGANLLCDHDTRDVVGVVESISIGADRVGRAVVRFGKSARAEEVFQDVLGGIRQNVSVGYMIHKAVLVETLEGRETYRVTDWEPYEVSLVSVPADATVGVGRPHLARLRSAPIARIRRGRAPPASGGRVGPHGVGDRLAATSQSTAGTGLSLRRLRRSGRRVERHTGHLRLE